MERRVAQLASSAGLVAGDCSGRWGTLGQLQRGPLSSGWPAAATGSQALAGSSTCMNWKVASCPRLLLTKFAGLSVMGDPLQYGYEANHVLGLLPGACAPEQASGSTGLLDG